MSRSVILSELIDAQYLSANVAGQKVNGISLDSRRIEPGNLFIALAGNSDDGKKYICQAAEKGATVVLTDADEDIPGKFSGVMHIQLPDLPAKVSSIAHQYYKRPSDKLEVIGITGTNGKTSCAHLLGQALALLGESCGVIGTLGYGRFNSSDSAAVSMQATGMTTPDAIGCQAILAGFVDQQTPYVAMEVSSHGLQQHRVDAVNISTAVLTNLTHDHLDYHGSFAEYARAKSRLFRFASVRHAVLNLDDDFSTQVMALLDKSVQLLTVSTLGRTPPESMSQRGIHLSLSHSSNNTAGMVIGLQVTSNGQQHHYEFSTRLIGDFNVGNILLVIATLLSHGFALEKILSTIPQWAPVAGRMQALGEEADDIQVVLDYAHTPDALEKALQALKPRARARLWCVFGCGGDRDSSKRPMMAKIAETLADEVIVTSDNPRFEKPAEILADMEAGFSQNHYRVIEGRRQAIYTAIRDAKAGDLVLVAGKGHEDYQIIGAEKRYFSDLDEARQALQLRQQNRRDKHGEDK